MSMIDIATAEKKIAERLDANKVGGLSVSEAAGGIVFRDVGQVMEFAKLMAVGGIAVRKHLRGNVGACLAVTIQALEWRMSPYAVANKSYTVNDQIAYEAQLIASVVLMRAPIAENEFPDYTYDGNGTSLRCTVRIAMRGGKTLEYTSPTVGEIKVKNSPLWVADPEQQLGYYSIRAWARRHVPHVILGVYSDDELAGVDDTRAARARDVTPIRNRLDAKLDHIAAKTTTHDPDTGEIIEDGTSIFETGTADDQSDAPKGGESDAGQGSPSDDATEEESPLVAEGRAAAMKGVRAFKFWQGKLSEAQYKSLGDQIDKMKAIAEAADKPA